MRRRDFIISALFGGLTAPPLLFGDHSVVSQNPLIAEYNLESLESIYTPTADFYVRCHGSIPAFAGQARLRIEGEVEKSLTLNASDLAHLPRKRLGAVLECSGDGVGPYALAGNAVWEGWALKDVLEMAHPRSSAGYLHLYGADGFLRSVPASRVAHDALLATSMNRQPLAPEHGGAWRAFFPGWYGMDAVKWLERIVLAGSPIQPIPDDYQAIVRGKNGTVHREVLPPVQMKSAFIYPAVGAVLRRGLVSARGLVWSDGAPIMTVEVSPDGGKTWKVAKIEPGGKYEWKLWRATIELTQTGLVQIACKAIGPNGREQPAAPDPSRIDGYAYNVIEKIRVMVI
ncbi:MAG TPA: molybdopterin-dependent oxidoreductase [Terriglobia bacterium]|nr:molybdopterin-dependent oxidoreductase [Terriglobia bacterium]